MARRNLPTPGVVWGLKRRERARQWARGVLGVVLVGAVTVIVGPRVWESMIRVTPPSKLTRLAHIPPRPPERSPLFNPRAAARE